MASKSVRERRALATARNVARDLAHRKVGRAYLVSDRMKEPLEPPPAEVTPKPRRRRAVSPEATAAMVALAATAGTAHP